MTIYTLFSCQGQIYFFKKIYVALFMQKRFRIPIKYRFSDGLRWGY